MLEAQASADKEDCDTLIDPLNRQKQIEKLQKQAERIEKWLEENDAKIGANGRELQSNITDTESAKMMTSHGTIQGYIAQALVDTESILMQYYALMPSHTAWNLQWPGKASLTFHLSSA